VSAIGSYAFASCVSLISITIPNSVVTIGDFAFSSCNSLASVTIGNSVIRINRAFAGCNSLIAIAVDINNPAYSSLNGVLFNKNLTTLVAFPAGAAGSYTIPNGVTAIGNYAFESCPRLASVMIPNSVTSIGTNAFASCVSLISVTMANSVTTIRNYAFQGCINLTRVTIPNSVSIIANYAFSGCTSLTAVYFQGNAPSPGGSSVFGGDNKATIYYLPETAGWGATFAGRPAKLWNPLIQSSGPGLGVRTNGFGFNITGTTNIPILVEACSSIASASWISLQTCTLTNGSVYFSDPDWIDYPTRFYRIRSP
jgi:hypothetical protein